MLGNTEGGGQVLDDVNVGTFELGEEGAGVVPKCFEVAALPFGVQGIERQGTFARAARPGDDAESAQRQVDVYIMQVMRARPTDMNPAVGLGGGKFLDGPGIRGKSC